MENKLFMSGVFYNFSVPQVIKQADIKMVLSEGMPTHKDPFNKGKLIVLFNITFPEKLDPSVAKKLSSLLPKPKLPPVPAGAEDVHLEVFDGRQGKQIFGPHF